MNKPVARRSILAASLALGAAPFGVRAQSWPTRPVRVVEPGAPGGGNDTTLRLFAPHLERALGRAFVVENRAGAGGRIGVEAAVRAAPDGYTLLMGNAGSNGINAAIYRDLSYDLETDLTPISLMVTGPNALVINPRVFPVDNVAGLIAAIKTKPAGFYNYGS
jgi:tripartite-type tricarboxylate transporter receptor subunit TctC